MPDYKVKRIHIKPGKRLSLQRHKHRAEHWHIITGTAIVTRNNEQLTLNSGDSVDIPKGAIHRIENPGQNEMYFIEVQQGDYFGEDDIERLEDDFGRAQILIIYLSKNIVAGRNFYPNSPCHRLQHALVGLYASPPLVRLGFLPKM
jgi:mannose-6-phosphate isomerase-like protein (cupin superfamily)